LTERPASRLPRRDLLRAVVVLAGAPLTGACGESQSSSATQPQSNYFPQSVASGDPRPTSVVLWTRCHDPARPDDDLELRLELSLDAEFTVLVELAESSSATLLAQASAGGCIKVRLDGLEPGRHYFYRFIYAPVPGQAHYSRTGRTRTALDPNSSEPVRFGVISCQDFAGKRYHALAHLAQQTLDFVVHLGDYVYETIDDPSFQSPTPDREVRFSAPEEALDRDGNLAARSLGNYRDLYRTYRGDPDLQRLHELFPMIVIPDDHEFSNDCYGARANYSDGREDELDLERRHNADRAWVEYMPVDYVEEPASAFDESGEFPGNLRIYRSFVFGRQLELVLTDLRRYRPDHVVPENALPGLVFMSEGQALDLLGEVPEDAVAYVDVDAEEHAATRALARDVAAAQGFEPAAIGGLISLPWLNALLSAAGAEPLELDPAILAHGYAYHQLLKTQQYTTLGARYLVAEAPFLALAKLRFEATDGGSESLLGAEQKSWFLRTLKASSRTWKVWGNEYTLMRRRIDLREVTLAPAELQTRIVLTTEDWDGAPNERDALLQELGSIPNVVAFTGDLHAFFAGTPHASEDEDARIVEFVAGSVSSTTWLTGIERTIASDPSLPPQAALLASFVDRLLMDSETRPNPHIGYLDLKRNGFALVEAREDALHATLHLIDDALLPLKASQLPESLANLFEVVEFRVPEGAAELERLIDGNWRRWERATRTWV
jgi:alkaline phosphatase D